jgi:Regulator of Chromosome Condensation (RCC1) repeat protein
MIIQRLLKNKQRLYCLMLCTIACLVFSNLASAVEPQISAGRYHNLAVNDKGEVFWWGLYHDANFKLGLDEKAQGPTIVNGLPTVVNVATGMNHSLALAEDGRVYEWGFSPLAIRQFYTETNVQEFCKNLIKEGRGYKDCEKAMYERVRVKDPALVSNLPAAIAIAATDSQSLIISVKGEVYCWNPFANPKKIPGLSNIKSISLGHFHGVALSEKGDAYTWGGNVNGELGYKVESSVKGDFMCAQAEPKLVKKHVLAVSAGVNSTYLLQANGVVLGAGREPNTWLADQDRLMDPTYSTRKAEFREVFTIGDAVELAGGSQHLAIKTMTGGVFTAGYDGSGQRGFNTFKNIPNKVSQVKNKMDVVSISSTWDHVLALTKNGSVCAWGSNDYGAVRPDSKRESIIAPLPVVMKDGATPLNLADKQMQDNVVCGDEQWAERISLWDAEQEKIKTDSKRENDLAKRYNLDLRIGYHSTALIEAVRSNNQEAVKVLLKSCEQDINATDRYYKSAMDIAQSKGLDSIAALLRLPIACDGKNKQSRQGVSQLDFSNF